LRLAATLPRNALRQEPPPVKEPGFLLEKTARELASMAHSESIIEAAMGMATLNSVLEVDLRSCTELNAADLIVAKGQGRQSPSWAIPLSPEGAGEG
jgi:hypothetical protein